ncbi:hypothetical protein [Weissella viridescens]|uniref:hypothetical protein n=1 Tax=Weissella viridescens TaxID=1629 RepID=UPI001639A550|nr:hypothetical protein [Weissella viridescens]
MDYSKLSDSGKIKLITGFTSAVANDQIDIDVVDKNHIQLRWTDNVSVKLDIG